MVTCAWKNGLESRRGCLEAAYARTRAGESGVLGIWMVEDGLCRCTCKSEGPVRGMAGGEAGDGSFNVARCICVLARRGRCVGVFAAEGQR